MRNFMIDIWVWTKGKQMFVNINFNKIKRRPQFEASFF